MLKFYDHAGETVIGEDDASFCSLCITQATVKANDVKSVVNELKSLSAKSKVHRSLHHKLSVKWLGYVTNRPFEHAQIGPFMLSLCQQWPYFLHYAALYDDTYSELMRLWYQQADYDAYFQHQIEKTIELNANLWTFHKAEYRLRLEQELSHFARPPVDCEPVRIDRRAKG